MRTGFGEATCECPSGTHEVAGEGCIETPCKLHSSRENLSSDFPTRSDTNLTVQAQKMVGGLKFWILKVEGLYYPCSYM